MKRLSYIEDAWCLKVNLYKKLHDSHMSTCDVMLAKFEKLPRTESVDWMDEITNIRTRSTLNGEPFRTMSNLNLECEEETHRNGY